MSSSDTMLVAFTICSNMFFVPQPKLFNSLFDSLITSIFTHGLGAVIGISVGDELWVARYILEIIGIVVVSLNPKPIEVNWCCNWYDNQLHSPFLQHKSPLDRFGIKRNYNPSNYLRKPLQDIASHPQFISG